jgi:thiol:disulfide interchange protein/DsbC/DsbD-like thiol-disulfide interchange protein
LRTLFPAIPPLPQSSGSAAKSRAARVPTGARLVLVFVLALVITGAQPALALESTPVTTPHTTATLITDTDAVAPGTPFHVALRLQLAPGWHTYWRNPGDAGVPPTITLHLPDAAKAGPVDWPAPVRLRQDDLMSYAYTGDVILPMTVTPGESQTPLDIGANATWLVCKDICIPEQARFSLSLRPGTSAPSAEAPLFAESAQARPIPSPWQASVAPDGRLWVHGPGLRPATVRSAVFIPNQPGTIEDAAQQPLSIQPDGLVLKLPLAKDVRQGSILQGLLEVRDRSGQRIVATISAPAGEVPGSGVRSLGTILALAFVAGLILNLMPCVFPILAMKVLALVKGAHHERLHHHALSYVAGVLAAFLGLGGVLLGLRGAEAASGWGFQFQSPVFVAGMACLLFVIGLNLSGVFQVGTSVAGTGHHLTRRAGIAGSFFTGLLAVVVATPCTVPFMGAAVAAALAAPSVTGLLIFLAMGTGMAAPYPALVTLPGLSRLMPHPGIWMERLRQALAFPMYAAVAWLVWVISEQAGSNGVLATAVALVLTGFAAWAFGVAQTSFIKGRRIGLTAAGVALAAAVFALNGIAARPLELTPTASAADSFTPERLAALRSQGRPVFVDMSAAWCITCLVNEHVTLDAPAVRQAFAGKDVVFLRGDWTRRDPGITAFLHRFQRDGVPLYVYYPAGNGQPVLLPQILTQAIVLRALG